MQLSTVYDACTENLQLKATGIGACVKFVDRMDIFVVSLYS